MRPNVAALATLLVCGAASAQGLAIPGLPGGDAKGEPAVRLADDPKSRVARLRKSVMEGRQALVLRAQDAQRWEKQRAAVRARRAELVGLRASLVSDVEPDADDRVWKDGDTPEPPEPDAGPPDAGPADAGPADAGPAGDPDAAAPPAPDGGTPTGDGAVDAAPKVVDAAPKVIPRRGPQLLPVLKKGDLFLNPRVHPAELDELDRLTAGLEEIDEVLSGLLRLYADERGLLTEALAEADQLLKQLEPRKGEKKEKKRFFGLRAVEKLALEAHLATIELSLARARARQATAEAPEGAAKAGSTELDPITAIDAAGAAPTVAYAASHRQAEILRDELEKSRRDKARLSSATADLREEVTKARTLRFDLALIRAERDLDGKESELQLGLSRLAITPDELKWAQEKYERSVELRGKAIPRIESKRDALRASLSAPGSGPWSPSAAAEVQDTLLAERLVFERLKLERDAFRNDLIKCLADALDGNLPPKEFTDRYRAILDARAHKSRSEDLTTRCDGWRRRENEMKRGAPGPEDMRRRDAMQKSYLELQDVCMREEWVLATQSRLADIGRYHFDKLKWESRSVGWYAWRVLLTALFIAIAFLLSQLVGRLTHRLAGQDLEEDGGSAPAGWPSTEEASPWAARFLRFRRGLALVLYLGLAGLVWLYAAVWCINHVWDYPIETARLLSWATYPIFYISDRGVSVWSMAQIGVWAVAAVWTGRLLQRWISDNLLQHFSVDRGVRDAVGTMVRYVVILVGLGTGLASAGIGLGAMAVAFGVIGIGIGFGLRDIANNFISGFLILLERPIRKGDFIRVDDLIGQVREISARATIIETRDAVTVIVPNSTFITGNIINMTKGNDERIRTQMRVGVAYGSDVTLVEKTLLEVARRTDGVLSWPEPRVDMTEFGDSALEFVLHVWTERIRRLPELESALYKGVDAAFREAEIAIPFPQRTVHLFDETEDEPEDG